MSDEVRRALPHFAGIDVLRGLAVLAVVLHHVHLRFVLNHFDVATLLPKPVARVLSSVAAPVKVRDLIVGALRDNTTSPSDVLRALEILLAANLLVTRAS